MDYNLSHPFQPKEYLLPLIKTGTKITVSLGNVIFPGIVFMMSIAHQFNTEELKP